MDFPKAGCSGCRNGSSSRRPSSFSSCPASSSFPCPFPDGISWNFPRRQFSLRWYESFWVSLTWVQAARASLLTGLLTVIFSVPLGTLAA